MIPEGWLHGTIALAESVGAIVFLAQDGQPLADLGTAGRWAQYVGLLLVFGGLGWRLGAGRALARDDRRETRDRAMAALRRWVLLGGGVLVLAQLVRLQAQVLAFRFPGDPLTISLYGDILASSWGHGWMWQIAAAIAVAVGAAATRPATPGWWLVLAATGVLLFVTPLTGHAVGGEVAPLLAVPLQGLHVAAGSTWLGALFLLVVVGYRVTRDLGKEDREGTRADLVRAFSPIALAGGAIAMLAGVVLAVLYLGSWAALWETTYGRVLMVKVAAVLAAVALGAYNWRRLQPRLGAPGTSAALRRSASWELFFGSLLLAATAMLVAQPGPGG